MTTTIEPADLVSPEPGGPDGPPPGPIPTTATTTTKAPPACSTG